MTRKKTDTYERYTNKTALHTRLMQEYEKLRVSQSIYLQPKQELAKPTVFSCV